MWNGLMQKGKELGSKAKGIVQQIVVEADQSPQWNLQNNNKQKGTGSDYALKTDLQQREQLLQSLLQELKQSQIAQESLPVMDVLGEDVRKNVENMVNAILKENSKKFIDKAKQAMLSKIEERIMQMVDENLGDDITAEHKQSIKDIFVISYDERDMLELNSACNYDDILKLFVQKIEFDAQRQTTDKIVLDQAQQKKVLEELQQYIEIERKEILGNASNFESEINRLKEVLNSNTIEMTKTKEENTEWQNQLQDIKKKLAEIEKQNIDKDQTGQRMEQMVIQKSEQIAHISQQNDELVQQLKKLKAENQALSISPEMAEELKKAKESIQMLLEERSIQVEERRKLMEEKDKQEEELISSRQELEVLQQKEKSLAQSENQNNQQVSINNLEEAVNNIKSEFMLEKQEWGTKLNQAREDIEVKEKMIKDLQETSQKQTQDSVNQPKELVDLQQPLENHTNGLNSQQQQIEQQEGVDLKVLKNQFNELTVRFKSLDADHSTLVESYQKLVGETENLKNEHLELQDKYDSLEESYNSLKYKYEEISRGQLVLQQTHQNKTNELNLKTEQSIGEWKQKVVQLEKELETAKKQVTDLLKGEVEKQQGKTLIAELQKRLENKEGEIKQLQSQLIRIQEQLGEEQNLTDKKNQSDIAALVKSNEKLTKHIEAIKKGNKELINIMVEGFSSLATELEKLDISKYVQQIQDCVKNSSPEIMKDIQKFIAEARSSIVQHYFTQLSQLRNQEKNKYNKLQEQFTKSTEDLKTLQVKVKSLEKVESKLQELSDLVALQKQTIKKKETAFSELQIEFAGSDTGRRVEVAGLTEKVQELQQKLDTLTSENAILKEQNMTLLEDNNNLENNKEALEEKAAQATENQLLLKEKESTIQALEDNIASLQTIHEEFQRRSEALAKKYDTEIKKMRAELIDAKELAAPVEEMKIQMQQQEAALNEKNSKLTLLQEKLAESEKECEAIKSETHVLLIKLKNEAIKSEYQIDRRVISNFLIQYFDSNSSNQVKLQILDTMASVLVFSEEEKVKIGVQKQKLGFVPSGIQGEIQSQGQPPQKSLANKFISFLLSNDEEQNNNQQSKK